ncbi:MAG: orotidine-5'-phosphate decarboxylase [Pseudomonadota bacterium]
MKSNPVFVAIDTPDVAAATTLANTLKDSVGGIKLGLEFFTACGPAGVDAVAACGAPLFLDLKLHDIPNTVAGAVRSLSQLRYPPTFLTLHAQGGPAMIAAAAKVREEAQLPTQLLAVTVLTSLDAQDLTLMGVSASPLDQVERLGTMAVEAGADGCVCSPQEVAQLRANLGSGPALMVPGIRPAGSAVGDQKRVMTPAQAMAAGASHLVIGRPITSAEDPQSAAQAINAELSNGAG